ncbi:MAG: CTP synthetase [Paracoccus sp. (in: a-proteobacteria)]|uniref:CTP synthetase n=1 Tax=Paracoccus sp. TaxID=267 RepID=UPI0026DF5555|nr:CTP synthetase [Paracoccus sp. (in: a-proteobacteria)]MDO5612848.1 CTP synthetase [Paracoccus sp. (in: a-proteobacteria)]
MPRLFLLILSIAMGTLAGVGVIVVLVAGFSGAWPIIIGAAVGAVLSVPVSWLVARQIVAAEH